MASAMTHEQLWDHIAAFLKREAEKMWAWERDQQCRRILYHEVTELLRRYCEDNRIPPLRNPFIVVCDSTNNMPRAEEVTVVTVTRNDKDRWLRNFCIRQVKGHDQQFEVTCSGPEPQVITTVTLKSVRRVDSNKVVQPTTYLIYENDGLLTEETSLLTALQCFLNRQ